MQLFFITHQNKREAKQPEFRIFDKLKARFWGLSKIFTMLFLLFLIKILRKIFQKTCIFLSNFCFGGGCSLQKSVPRFRQFHRFHRFHQIRTPILEGEQTLSARLRPAVRPRPSRITFVTIITIITIITFITFITIITFITLIVRITDYTNRKEKACGLLV